MSIRTLIEVNHDYLHSLIQSGEAVAYLRSLSHANGKEVPVGIRFLGQRHHADPEFIGSLPLGHIVMPDYAHFCEKAKSYMSGEEYAGEKNVAWTTIKAIYKRATERFHMVKL